MTELSRTCDIWMVIDGTIPTISFNQSLLIRIIFLIFLILLHIRVSTCIQNIVIGGMILSDSIWCGWEFFLWMHVCCVVSILWTNTIFTDWIVKVSFFRQLRHFVRLIVSYHRFSLCLTNHWSVVWLPSEKICYRVFLVTSVLFHNCDISEVVDLPCNVWVNMLIFMSWMHCGVSLCIMAHWPNRTRFGAEKIVCLTHSHHGQSNIVLIEKTDCLPEVFLCCLLIKESVRVCEKKQKMQRNDLLDQSKQKISRVDTKNLWVARNIVMYWLLGDMHCIWVFWQVVRVHKCMLAMWLDHLLRLSVLIWHDIDKQRKVRTNEIQLESYMTN